MKRYNDNQPNRLKDYKKAKLNDDSLNLNNINRFNNKFPFYSKPTEIGYFSLNCNRSFFIDKSELKFLLPYSDNKNINFDLRAGYNDFIKKPEDENLDNLLKWLHESNYISTNKIINLDFVSWRGLLTKILCFPYENKDYLKIAIQKFNDVLYLCELKTEEYIARKLQETDREKEMCYWGLRFENYMTKKTDEKIILNNSVNANEEYGVVLKTQLENLHLILGAEVDCCHSVEDPSYVELKTSRIIDNDRQLKNFKRFKLIKWWSQSFLVGIENIVCGFRNDDGVVKTLEYYKTNDIPKMVQNINNSWNPAICFNFLLQFLKHVKKFATQNWNDTVYVFSLKPCGEITFVMHDNLDFAFLPVWYTN